MRNIDIKFLKIAKTINLEFRQLSALLSTEESKLSIVKEKLQQVVEDLKTTNKKLTESRSKNDAQPIYGILDELSIQYQKIENILNPIIKKIDQLRKDELVLFETVQRTYPELQPTEIKEQVQKYVFTD